MTFGRDTYCDESLRTGRLVTELALVAQNQKHRLVTVRGTLNGGEEEADYGMDLPGRIGSIANDVEAAALPGQIQSELTKDPRVLSVESTVASLRDSAGAVTWTVTIEVSTEDGDFTLAASDVTVEIVGLGGSS